MLRPPRRSPLFPYTTLFRSPRYVKLPDIMKAKKKPLDTVALAALGVEQRQQLKLVRFEPPPQRQKGIRVKDAADRKSTRLNSSHVKISYAVFCLKKKIQRK